MLTKRHVEILNLIKLGKGNKNIAFDLFVAEQTVKSHIGRILKELGAADRANAVYIAIKKGIIE